MTRTNEELIADLLEEAVEQGVITCSICGSHLEPDCEVCQCGQRNVLIEGGYI